MIYFPNISNPAYPFTESFENNSLMSKFEDGTVLSRPKFTKSRRTWKLKWQGLPSNEYVLLRDFIRNTVKYSAKTFMWTNPASLSFPERETVEVRITEVGEWNSNVLDKWDGEITLQEV